MYFVKFLVIFLRCKEFAGIEIVKLYKLMNRYIDVAKDFVRIQIVKLW